MPPDADSALGTLLHQVFPWIGDGAQVILVLTLLGKALRAFREGHGLVGYVRSVLYGSASVPPAPPPAAPPTPQP